jgi:hypothetical protein
MKIKKEDAEKSMSAKREWKRKNAKITECIPVIFLCVC